MFFEQRVKKEACVTYRRKERGRNMDAILWLAAVVVLLVIEIATLGLTTIWFAGGALIAGIAAVAGAGRVVQFVLFLIVSLILLIFTRPIAMRYLNTNRTRTNAESLIGKEAVVTQTIENLNGRVDAIIDGGATAVGIESTIISLVGKPVILRHGAVSDDEIAEALGI